MHGVMEFIILFFTVGPPLLFPVYFQYMVFKHPIVRGLWTVCFIFIHSIFFYLTCSSLVNVLTCGTNAEINK
jgi:hypothetical protein